jgi:hypothetical protein
MHKRISLIHFLLPYTSRIQRLSRPSLARGVESPLTCTAAVPEIEEVIIAGVKLFAVARLEIQSFKVIRQ